MLQPNCEDPRTSQTLSFMKLDRHGDKLQDKQEIHAPRQQEAQLKYLGSMKAIPGLTLWQYHLQTSELTKAEFEEAPVVFHEGNVIKPKKKVLRQNDCLYVQALNVKNAVKKLNKMFIANGSDLRVQLPSKVGEL